MKIQKLKHEKAKLDSEIADLVKQEKELNKTEENTEGLLTKEKEHSANLAEKLHGSEQQVIT